MLFELIGKTGTPLNGKLLETTLIGQGFDHCVARAIMVSATGRRRMQSRGRSEVSTRVRRKLVGNLTLHQRSNGLYPGTLKQITFTATMMGTARTVPAGLQSSPQTSIDKSTTKGDSRTVLPTNRGSRTLPINPLTKIKA